MIFEIQGLGEFGVWGRGSSDALPNKSLHVVL